MRACAAHCGIAQRVPQGAPPAPVRYRCHCGLARSPACHSYFAIRRRGFFLPLAIDQRHIHAWRGRWDLGRAQCERRIRSLAAAVLGTHNPRRAGFRTARRLHSLQSDQARPRESGAGLAAFIVSSICAAGIVAVGLGWRRRRARQRFRRTASLNFVARISAAQSGSGLADRTAHPHFANAHAGYRRQAPQSSRYTRSRRALLLLSGALESPSIVAVDPLAPLVALLRLDRQRRDRAGFEPAQRDRLAGFLAIAVGAVVDALRAPRRSWRSACAGGRARAARWRGRSPRRRGRRDRDGSGSRPEDAAASPWLPSGCPPSSRAASRGNIRAGARS